MVEDFITDSWNRSVKSVIHLIQRDILESKDPLGVVVRDHHTVHIANPYLETLNKSYE